MYALGIYWHYTLFEMLFAFAHDIQFSMQLSSVIYAIVNVVFCWIETI